MFILINELLLENRRYTSDEKIILSMLNQFRKANANYWGSYKYIANKCGLSVEIVRSCFAKFCDIGILINEHNGFKLLVDIENSSLPECYGSGYKFDENAFIEKFNELKDKGYQIIVECNDYIQLVHPDKPGLVMLNK